MPIIQFNLQESPHAKDEEAKSYYPVVANSDKLTVQELCRLINERCTLTESDVLGVMMSAAHIIAENIARGSRVELPELGVFAPSIVSDEPITDVDNRQIARHLRVNTINFRPSASLMKQVPDVTFRRVDKPVIRRVSQTEQQLLACIQKLCEALPLRAFDRQDFQEETGFSRTRACEVLRELTARGIIVKQGKQNSPYYTLNND